MFSFSFGIQVKTRLGQTKLYPKILPPCFVLVLCEVCDTERGANTILTLSCLRQSLKTSLFCAFLTIVSACIQNQPLTQGPEDFHSFWSISPFFMLFRLKPSYISFTVLHIYLIKLHITRSCNTEASKMKTITKKPNEVKKRKKGEEEGEEKKEEEAAEINSSRLKAY